MANFRVNYYSNALHRTSYFMIHIPNDPRMDAPQQENPYQNREMRTLFLLNGYTGDASNFIPEELSRKYHFAVVVPEPENGFYLDGASTGHAYETMVAVELVEYVRKTFGLAKTPEDTYVFGLSMGGFGALHTGLAHPDVFGKIGAMSSALIVHEIAGMKEGESTGVANYAYYRECFGDLETVEKSRNNPEVLAKELIDCGAKLPQIYMSCGTEDFLIENNREMHAYLNKIGYPHIYKESAGIHDMKFWLEYTEKIAEWMFAE